MQNRDLHRPHPELAHKKEEECRKNRPFIRGFLVVGS